ncbi:MAG: hypothetical protein PHN89_00520 [Candidatus Pacebacteria bacterium]|nr:hypothetical protein [Candidatus Paceibacterota bacterium]
MEKLDVVYILRNSGTRWGNNEIRHSVRSLENHLEFGKLWIVGNLPKFFDKSRINFVEANDCYSNKIKNAIFKISTVCKEDRLSENFILMNDDFFFLKKKGGIEYFNKGKLKATMKNHETKGGYYYKAIKNTVAILRDMGINDPVDFEMHYPIVFNKIKFIEMVNGIDEREVYLFRSVYGNLNIIKSKYRKDVKIFNVKQFKKKNKIDFMSTDDKVVMSPMVQKWIVGRFGSRSTFEKKPKKGYFCNRPIVFGGASYNAGDIIIGDIPEKVVKENGMKRINRDFY